MKKKRPVVEEDDLRRLNTLPKSKLRKEFVTQLNFLKDKILTKSTPKQLNGVNLNSRMYCSMVQSYVEIINKGGVPNISTA